MNHRSWAIRTLICTLGCLSATSAYADGMRCGSKLVSDGDMMFDVRSACGTPDATSRRTELRAVRRWVDGPCQQYPGGVVRCGYLEERVVEVAIDEWTYDFGPHALVRHLTFEQERLRRVATGGYGTKEQ